MEWASRNRPKADNTEIHRQNYYIISDSIRTENPFYSQILLLIATIDPNSKKKGNYFQSVHNPETKFFSIITNGAASSSFL